MTDSGWVEGDDVVRDLLTPDGGTWVEARTTATGKVTWAAHIAGDDLKSGVDRAREALAHVEATEPVGPSREDVWDTTDASPVIDALTTRPMTMQELLAATGHADAVLRKVMRSLEHVGTVTHTTGERGRKTYALRSAQRGIR